MGITGAGGAITAIPLFQIFVNSTLKEATVLSLITVFFGTVVNLLSRMREVNWRIALGLTLSGTVANYLSLPLKTKMPESVIVILLIMIGLFSISSIWRSPKSGENATKETNFVTVILIGLFLGLITTLTGLGGGVLLIPLLLRVFGMSYEEALPTSLGSIMLISLSALFFQGEKALELIKVEEILYLGAGALAAFATLKLILRYFSPAQVLKLRKLVFSMATLISLIIVIFKAT